MPARTCVRCHSAPAHSPRAKYCEPCRVEQVKASIRRWRQTEKGKANQARAERLRRAAKAEYYQENRSRILAGGKAWNAAHRARISDYNKQHYAQKRERYRARAAVRTAVKSGRLTMATACNRCTSSGSPLIGHHHSYAPEHWLDVEWLCRTCHARHHAQEVAA